eukprot:gene14250-16818_t
MPVRTQPFGQFLSYQFKNFWPFVVGGVVWAGLITKVHMGITDENRKESVYWQKVQRLQHPELFKNEHGHGHGGHH